MGWQDDFAVVGQALSGAPKRSSGYTPFSSKVRGAGFDTRASRPGSVNWSDFASGRMSTSRPATSRPKTDYPAIEKVNASLPYSSSGPRSPYAPPPGPQPSTQGDLIGSIGGAVSNVVSNLNLGNVVPWFMERANVAATDLANSGIPVVSNVAGVGRAGTQAFVDAVGAASQVIGPVIDGFPTWVRDGQLNDRAKLYRAIANGEVPDYGFFGPASNPLATLGQIAGMVTSPALAAQRAQSGQSVNLFAGATGQTVSEQAWQAKQWQDTLLHSVDPNRRLDAEQRLAILRDSIDLPESVKLQLERKPGASDDEIAAWFDEAPEGKAWSYAEGPAGIVQNMGTPLLFFLAEARAGYGAAKGVGALGGALSGASGIGGAVSTGIAAAGRGISLTARLQTAAVASGIGITAVNATMGSIARYQGNEEAIAWFDNANRTTPFSDDPMVQLVTGFTVNPATALNMATKGRAGAIAVKSLRGLKHNLFDVPLNAIARGRLDKFYASTDVTTDMIRRMFKLGSNEEAAVFLDEQGLREQAPDMIFGNALDIVLDRLPAAERIAWNGAFSDPVERAAATVARFKNQALDLIQKEPDLIAARFYDHDWNYRMMPGPFNAEVAAKIALDYRRAMNRTYDLRAQDRATIGYREYLPPQGQTLARSMLDAATVDGRVPMKALQSLVGDLPALRKHWGGLVRNVDESVPRATADQMVDAAAAEWATAAKVNPVKTRTGMDPVLRPDSPTLQRDYAEALGTNIDTVKAVSDTAPANLTTGQVDLLRRFLVDKDVLDETAAASLTPEAAWAKAADYIDEKTAPWLATGARVSSAETQMVRLRGELARVRREGGSVEADRTVRIQREINELTDLVRLAGDPIQTYASATAVPRGLGDMHLAELASRKVDALDRLRVIQSIDSELSAAGLTETDLVRVVRGADGELTDIYDMIGAPPKPVLDAYLAFRTANMQVFKSRPGELTARRQFAPELSVRGQELVRDTEAAPGSYQWAQIASSPGFVKRLRTIGDQPAFYSEMTGNQMADIIEAAGLKRGVTGQSMDDIAAQMTATREATAKERLAGTLGDQASIRGDKVADAQDANLAVSDARGGTRESGGAIKGEPPGPVTREQALRRLDELRSARERALDGKGVAAAKRTAGIKVPDDYVAQAEADKAARALVYDAEYDAFWHPRNVAKVQEITSNPDELWPGLRAVAEADPAIMEGIERVAATRAAYHGTLTPFDAYDATKAQANALYGPGLYVTDSRAIAEGYANPMLLYPTAKPTVQRGVVRPNPNLLDADQPMPTEFVKKWRSETDLMGDAQYQDGVGGYAGKAFAESLEGGALLGDAYVAAANATHAALGFRDIGTLKATVNRLLADMGYDGLTHVGGKITGAAPHRVRILFDGDMVKWGDDAAPSGAEAIDAVFSDPTFAAAVRAELVPAGFEAPVEGMIREWTDLDYLITSSDDDAIAALSEQMAAARAEPRPAVSVPKAVAERLAQMPKKRRSYQYRRQLSDGGADFTASPSASILANPKNKLGVDVLSVMNHGITGTKPATLRGVVALLRDIEDGAATRSGIGPELQAEGQRVARELLDDAVKTAKRNPDDAGTFMAGAFPEDEQALAAEINDLLTFDQADPLGTLQYGLKKAPKDAIVMEWSKIPGLAEELLTKRFAPIERRLGTTQVRQAFNLVFGPRSNQAIRLQTRNRFAERAGRIGVTPQTADAMWEGWYKLSHDSRMPSLRKRKTGERDYVPGDQPLYADVWNVPNARLDAMAQDTVKTLYADGKITAAEARAAREVDWADVFRESASWTRRGLADSRIPLGKAIADAYGTVAHNQAATTLYYLFRFGMDIRYHAMNYLESQILYLGRAGLRRGEIDEGLMGQSEGYLRNLDSDPTNNTAYTTGRDRMAYAYKTFLKEQPEALRKGLKGLASEDPALMQRAMRELAGNDPQLRDMIDAMGSTPEKYLGELDAWHRKMLNNVDEANDSATIDLALSKEMAASPNLAEVFDRIGQVNKDLWTDIRGTFYGNPNRSQAERVLNSYLLYWPLSYQIKSTKWFLKVLFDRAGGIQTNALGAVTLDRMADTHNRLLATDPEYRDWFEKHDTLVFVSQMFFPVSLDQTGVSLNPILRSLFLDRAKAGMEIGPIYTFNKVIRPGFEELMVDLYPALKDVPVVNEALEGAYRGATGRREPAPN